MNWFHLLLAFFSLFCLGLADNVRGPVFPDFLQEFALNDSKGSWFFLIASLFSLLNNLLSVWWLPRLGTFRSLRLYLVVMALGLALLGVAQTFTMAIFGMAVVGIAFGGLGVAQNLLVGQSATPATRARAFSALHSMYGISSLLAPGIVSLLYTMNYRWQSVFLVLTVFPLALFACTFLRRPRVFVRAKANESRWRGEWRSISWIAILTAAYVVAEIIMSSRLVLLVRREWGYDVVTANRQLTLFFVLLFIGRLLFAVFSFRLRSMFIMRLSIAVSLLSFALGLVFANPLALVLTGLGMAPFFPAVMSFVQEHYGPYRDAAVSWTMIAMSIGLILMHRSVGALSDHIGLASAMWIGPICLGLSLIALCLPRVPLNDLSEKS